MKKRVLVFPCGSEIGLEVHRSLSQSTHFELIGASSVDDHGRFVYDNYVDKLPMVDSEDFIEELNKVIRNYRIDFVIPAHDSVVLKLAKSEADGEIDCKVVGSSYKTCAIARSKVKTYNFLNKYIKTPAVFRGINDVNKSDLPVFLKPDIGQGSKGTYMAKTIEEIAFYKSRDESLMILEYLPGEEYTIDCFTDVDGELRVALPRVRKRTASGISVRSEIVDDNNFYIIARELNKCLEFRGVWFFQLKRRNNGELVLLEVAPRVAGTMALSRCRGINLPLLALFDMQDNKINIEKNDYDIIIDRALENKYKHNIEYGHVYIDFDDLIIFDGLVSPKVMAYVFQCINRDVKVHLITKHKSDLEKTLTINRLSGIFDEIIWIKDGKEKHTFIKYEDSIFIDDSYAERAAVKKKCGIPVFDAHMIESLME